MRLDVTGTRESVEPTFGSSAFLLAAKPLFDNTANVT